MIASTFCGSRPSLKFGTHSTKVCTYRMYHERPFENGVASEEVWENRAGLGGSAALGRRSLSLELLHFPDLFRGKRPTNQYESKRGPLPGEPQPSAAPD